MNHYLETRAKLLSAVTMLQMIVYMIAVSSHIPPGLLVSSVHT